MTRPRSNNRLVTKTEIDLELAERLGVSQRQASEISTTYLQLLGEHLGQLHNVLLPGFGQFRVCAYKASAEDYFAASTKTKIRVSFSKSAPMKKIHRRKTIRGLPMDKFGVDENVNQEQLEKQAAQGCPKCGAQPKRHGNVLLCPNCGSEPFEGAGHGEGKGG